MSTKESKIHHYFEQVKNKSISLKMAAGFIQLSYRQAKRVWKRYKALGVEGLISRKRGKRSSRRISERRREEIAGIIARKYPDFKPGFAAEKLGELDGIIFSSETIRQIMIEYKIWFPRKGKMQIHPRRERRACVGELLQTDASDDMWFEERGPRCHLYIIVDDATSEVTDGHFELEETTEGYFKLFQRYFERNGLPVSIYSDKRGVFKVNQGEEGALTQFGRAMKELGIEMIYAHSAPAKGRVERTFETLQDRLVREMRLQNICTIEEGNAFIQTYLEKHNQKYRVEPRSPHNAHLPLESNKPLKYTLCYKSKRVVSKNLEVNYKNKIYQIENSQATQHLRKVKIEVIETLDGEILFEKHGENIKFRECSNIANLQQNRVLKEPKTKAIPMIRQGYTNLRKFSKVVEMRGYYEREELLTLEEKRQVQLRMENRKRIARNENKETLNLLP